MRATLNEDKYSNNYASPSRLSESGQRNSRKLKQTQLSMLSPSNSQTNYSYAKINTESNKITTHTNINKQTYLPSSPIPQNNNNNSNIIPFYPNGSRVNGLEENDTLLSKTSGKRLNSVAKEQQQFSQLSTGIESSNYTNNYQSNQNTDVPISMASLQLPRLQSQILFQQFLQNPVPIQPVQYSYQNDQEKHLHQSVSVQQLKSDMVSKQNVRTIGKYFSNDLQSNPNRLSNQTIQTNSNTNIIRPPSPVALKQLNKDVYSFQLGKNLTSLISPSFKMLDNTDNRYQNFISSPENKLAGTLLSNDHRLTPKNDSKLTILNRMTPNNDSKLNQSESKPSLGQISSKENKRNNIFGTRDKQIINASPFKNKERIQQNQIGTPPNQNVTLDSLDMRMIPRIDKSKISSKQIGNIQAYGANTHQGLIRGYNEDRVSIILNMIKPPEKNDIKEWPVISYFAIYDGHGGARCADFLRDQLHFLIVKDEEFPRNPARAIHNGFLKAEEEFLKMADSYGQLDKSDDTGYVANLGDSRAVLSQDFGQKVIGLTVDHKPNQPDEERRIIANGGKIYQYLLFIYHSFYHKDFIYKQRSQIPTLQPKQFPQFIKGPHRVLPGRLAVSRTMGDAEAKLKKYGGNPHVISCEPDITNFSLKNEYDFVIYNRNHLLYNEIGDGVFDKLSNQQSIGYLWESIREQQKKKEMRSSLHDYIGESIQYLLRQTFIHKSFDNITIVVVCFKSLNQLLSLC